MRRLCASELKASKGDGLTKHNHQVNLVVMFLLIGIIIVMITSVVFNLVFLNEDSTILPAGLDVEGSLASSGSATGVVTLEIIEPPNSNQNEQNLNTERGLDS